MSRYDYQCPQCNKIIEIERSIKAKEEPVFCDCGCQLVRIYNNVSLNFVGDGWQTNDVKNK